MTVIHTTPVSNISPQVEFFHVNDLVQGPGIISCREFNFQGMVCGLLAVSNSAAGKNGTVFA
jgi:hypothetical protein